MWRDQISGRNHSTSYLPGAIMACANVFDAFRYATEALGEEICRLACFHSVVLDVVPRGVFPKHSGLNASVFTVRPNEPVDENRPGDTIVLADGSNAGVCNYSFKDLSIGFDEVTYGPRRLQWRGPLFCKDDAYFAHAPDEFLSAYVEEMTNYVQMDIENHLLYWYMRMVPIYVANANFGITPPPAPSATLTAPVATSELTMDMLDRLAMQLVTNRASPDDKRYVELGGMGPLYTLYVGAEASQRILRSNADFRMDIRYSDPTLLLNRLGANQAVKNWKFLIWTLPYRFTHDGTKYINVPRFVSSAATKGTKTDVNPNWINPTTAPYEVAIVLSPEVMKSELIIPDSRVDGVTWPTTNYMGNWNWVTGPEAVAMTDGDACYDPLRKRGRHIAEYLHALRPGCNTKAGAIIFHKRCPKTMEVVGCS
jgi:hypothetical protein